MKIKRYTVTVPINLTQNPSVWLCERGFVVCQSTDFLTGAGIRSQKMWENSWTQKDQKLTRYYFKISAKKKKKTIHKPATIEYQLNDSLFSSFNGTSLMRWWIHECYIFKKGWRNKIIEDHDRLTDHDSCKPMARVFPASFNDSPFNLAPGPRR